MSASKKILKPIMLIILLVVAGGGVYLYKNFGDITKRIAERTASNTLGVPVSIGNIAINLGEKSVTVSGIKVGNPKGYKGAQSVTVETVYMKAQTLSQTLLRFNDITVSGTEVYLEVRPNGTNLTDIKKNVNAKADQGDKAAQQIKVIIENMRIEKMRVYPSILLANTQNLEPVIVPDIFVRGVGVRENGVLAREAIGQVWTQISQSVSGAANRAGFYEGLSPDALQEIGVGQIQKIKGDLQKEIDNLGDGLKGLFGGE